MVPMLTLSWLWHSVERENTLAGMVFFNASAVQALVLTKSGVKTNSGGYTIIPSAQPYRKNRVSLDTDSLADNVAALLGEIGRAHV